MGRKQAHGKLRRNRRPTENMRKLAKSYKIRLKKQNKPILFPDFLISKNLKIKIFKPNFDVFWVGWVG